MVQNRGGFFLMFSVLIFENLERNMKAAVLEPFPVILGGPWRMQQHFWYWEIHPAKFFSRLIHVILQNIWVYDSLRHLKFGTPNPVMYWKSILTSQAGNKHSWPVTSFTKQYVYNCIYIFTNTVLIEVHTHMYIYIYNLCEHAKLLFVRLFVKCKTGIYR